MGVRDAVIAVLIGYCFGLVIFGYILGRLEHIDLRTKGSGNVGTTNAARVLGKRQGLLTLVCDIGKGLAAAGVVWLLFHNRLDGSSAAACGVRLLMSYAAFGAVMGHDFPVYLGFKGGKGVATSLAFLAIVNPRIMGAAALFFIVVVAVTRYVSLGSILTTIFAVLLLYGFGGLDDYLVDFVIYRQVAVLVAIVASVLILKHRSNIERLLLGEENKLSFKKKES